MRQIVVVFCAPLFLWACGPTSFLPQTSDLDFSSGEHVVLGDNGYRMACAQAGGCGPALVRADGKKSFSYGELVALSGDFYAAPEDVYREKVEPFWKWDRNDVDDVKKNFQSEIQTIENFLHGHSQEAYPDFNVSYAWNYPDYLALTLSSTNHFGFYNMIAYVDYHGRALELARQAYEASLAQSADASRLLTEALFMNAFGDHFLTDGFASGHVRAPRLQILHWATQQNLSDRAAGTLAKIIHDRDGEVRVSGEHGLSVTNAHGDAWLTRCDSQLFWENSLEDPSIQLPVQAVAASVGEVLSVYRNGESIPGVYAATELVPFPGPAAPNLTGIFPADMSEGAYDQIVAQMPFYTKIKIFSGVDKGVLKKLTASLPNIMQEFRADVQNEIKKRPELSWRLPSAYLEAYQSIH